MLVERRDQYKTAAIKTKQAGNDELAIKYLRTAKVFPYCCINICMVFECIVTCYLAF